MTQKMKFRSFEVSSHEVDPCRFWKSQQQPPENPLERSKPVFFQKVPAGDEALVPLVGCEVVQAERLGDFEEFVSFADYVSPDVVVFPDVKASRNFYVTNRTCPD